MNSLIIESLKRLYSVQKISLDKIRELLDNKKITQSDFVYITSDEIKSPLTPQ